MKNKYNEDNDFNNNPDEADCYTEKNKIPKPFWNHVAHTKILFLVYDEFVLSDRFSYLLQPGYFFLSFFFYCYDLLCKTY